MCSVATVGVDRFGEKREQIYVRRSKRSCHRDRAPGRPEAGYVAVQGAHAPKIISRCEQIPRDHVIGAAWAHQESHRTDRKIGTCVEFEVVARYLRVRSIRPIYKEWKLHSCCVRRRDGRHACWDRSGIGYLHGARYGRKTAHAIHGNGADSIIDGEWISPNRAGLCAEPDRSKCEGEWIRKCRFVIRFEDIGLSVYH